MTYRRVVSGLSVLATIVSIGCLIAIPRVANNPTNPIQVIEPSASPELRDEPRSRALRGDSARSKAGRHEAVRRPPPSAEDRERDLFVGLMLYLGGQHQTHGR